MGIIIVSLVAASVASIGLPDPTPESMRSSRAFPKWVTIYSQARNACNAWAAISIFAPVFGFIVTYQGFAPTPGLLADAKIAEWHSMYEMRTLCLILSVTLIVLTSILAVSATYLMNEEAPENLQIALLRIQRWRRLIAVQASLVLIALTSLLALGDLGISAPFIVIIGSWVIPVIGWVVPHSLEASLEEIALQQAI